VTFDIDANGILHVSAKDKGTGKENKITIKANSGLSDEEINRMVKDAEAHAEEDKKAHELVDTRNQCDAMVHSVKKALTDHGDKIEADEKAKIEAAIKEAEEVMKGNDKDAIEAKTQALGQASQKLGEKIYAETQQQAGGAAGGAPGGEAQQDKKNDADVVDAEFTEVKDKKA
jgi:molecular chaperone DnaK